MTAALLTVGNKCNCGEIALISIADELMCPYCYTDWCMSKEPPKHKFKIPEEDEYAQV
jgi:hypothetical protein